MSTALRAHASLILDLAAIAPARRPGDRLIGSATWDGPTGDYTLTYGATVRSRTYGHGSAVNMVDAIARHGYRTDAWESVHNGTGVRCQLWVTAPAAGGMVVTYGGKLAHAYWSGDGRYLSVHLLRDPGAGSMLFTRIAPSAVRLVAADPGNVDAMRARLRDSLTYLTPDGFGARWVRDELARLDTPGSVHPVPA